MRGTAILTAILGTFANADAFTTRNLFGLLAGVSAASRAVLTVGLASILAAVLRTVAGADTLAICRFRAGR